MKTKTMARHNYTQNFIFYIFAIFFIVNILFCKSLEARSAPDSFAELAEKLLPSVVNISTTQIVEGRPTPQMPQLPPGSPFEDFFQRIF